MAEGVRREAPARERNIIPPSKSLLPVYLFIIGLAVPIQLFVGSFRISPYRIVLLIILIPVMASVFTGKAGKIRVPDILVLLHCLWVAVALNVAHGPEIAVEASGIFFVEVAGAYFLARRFIRTEEDLHKLVRFMFIIILLIIPFVAVESITGQNIILKILAPITTFGKVVMDPRWGLQRSQGPFEHPILLGVFCASMFALSYYVLGYGKSMIKRVLGPVGVVTATFFSLSAGPFFALASQAGFIGWDIVTRRVPSRWLFLGGLFCLAYITIDLLSNRSPVEVFISNFTFSSGNAWNRVHIWNFGTAEIGRHPIFGIGFNEWNRAYWMSTSMDNYWLAMAVRYGMPTFLFFSLSVLYVTYKIGRLPLTDERTISYRKGILIALAGYAIAGTTVNFWNATLCLIHFLVGASVWLLDAQAQAPAPSRSRARPTHRASDPGSDAVNP